jgi:hypothetical protein
MSRGPVELLVVAFPSRPVGSRITSELRALVDARTVRILDGVVVRKDDAGALEMHELDEPDLDPTLVSLRTLITDPVDLVAGEDIEELAELLIPGGVAAVLAIEHLWAAGLRDAVTGSGGVVVADVNVPSEVVDEVIAASAS